LQRLAFIRAVWDNAITEDKRHKRERGESSIRYDTSELRQLAGRLKDAAATISDTLRENLGPAQAQARESFEGSMADALAGRLEQVRGRFAQSSERLEELGGKLFDFAAKLEETDAQSKDIIEAQ